MWPFVLTVDDGKNFAIVLDNIVLLLSPYMQIVCEFRQTYKMNYYRGNAQRYQYVFSSLSIRDDIWIVSH